MGLFKHSRDVKLPKFQTKTYVAWQNMRQRCTNPARDDYVNYGGRGIKVCDRWNSYDLFLADMGEAPEYKSLDRIDNNGDYTPENCKWSSASEQVNNRRDRSLETKIRPNNTSGLSGVYWTGPKQTWQVKCKGKATKTFYNLFDAACYRLS